MFSPNSHLHHCDTALVSPFCFVSHFTSQHSFSFYPLSLSYLWALHLATLSLDTTSSGLEAALGPSMTTFNPSHFTLAHLGVRVFTGGYIAGLFLNMFTHYPLGIMQAKCLKIFKKLSMCLLSGRNFSLFNFRLLTSQDSHAHSLSHGNLITPLTLTVLLPPYNSHIKTNTDKNIERSQLDYGIPELSKDNDNN